MSAPELSIEWDRKLQAAALALDGTAVGRKSGPIFARGLRDIGNAVRRKVRANLRPHRKSGHMISNVRVRVRGRSFDTEVGVKSTGAASNLIAGGVKPHRIAPGGVMPIWMGHGAWKRGKGAGITGFATVVEHPGFRGDPFFARALDDAKPEIDAIQRDLTTKIVRSVIGGL